MPASSPQVASRSHDWRAPGYVSAVGGRLYDPDCRPFRSAGINVPNLPYRQGIDETLEWMRRHNMRWMRVFATGHSLGPDRAPRDAAAAATALRQLLNRVEAFNAAHGTAESIYVLVALTDYYPQGVPGDRHAYDHPRFRESPVLPAPWYRAGVRQFDFEQEHGFGRLAGLPNYEVFYKPWVQHLVSALATGPGSRALLGWQLGNELKARNSPRNGITPDQAYEWYLAFTRDMVDTIRAADTSHLVVMGAQYMAELVDWEYRPQGEPVPDLLPTYRTLVQRALDACGSHCWNVWGLTGYDFNLYALDDAAAFGEAGVASLLTEYGFTLGTPEETRQRFGGDRPAAVRDGLSRPWRDLSGRSHDRLWGVRELLGRAPIAGVASWGSPAPGADAGMDMDSRRGITGAPDEAALWAAWRDVGAQLEAANRTAGPSGSCLAHSGAGPLPGPVPTPPPAPPAPRDERYFLQTQYRIDHDPFWAYFSAMGGVDTFGYPVSRSFTLLGCTTQVFQRHLLQQCGGAEGAVRPMNLLDSDLMPYERINGSTLPPVRDVILAELPAPGDPAYAGLLDGVLRRRVPEATPSTALMAGKDVRFLTTYLNTVPTAEERVTGSSPRPVFELAALTNLEVWGFPTSFAQPDPANAEFVYLRFQRGVMHHDGTTGETRALLLADWFKTILTGRNLPPDLAVQARESRFFGQYCPERPGWLCRPEALPGTDLTFAFEAQ